MRLWDLGNGNSHMSVVTVIKRQVKRIKESIEQFKRGNRDDLVEKENKNLEALKAYLPKELSGEELVSRYNQRLSQDERIRAEYNYEKFKETFEAEMAKQR